jgi:hypothetical protein
MASSASVHLLLNFSAPPQVRACPQPPDPDYPRLAEVVHLYVEDGHQLSIDFSGTPRQLRELLLRLSATLRQAITARHAADPATEPAGGNRPGPGPPPPPIRTRPRGALTINRQFGDGTCS